MGKICLLPETKSVIKNCTTIRLNTQFNSDKMHKNAYMISLLLALLLQRSGAGAKLNTAVCAENICFGAFYHSRESQRFGASCHSFADEKLPAR
jgi:hypothetical protein